MTVNTTGQIALDFTAVLHLATALSNITETPQRQTREERIDAARAVLAGGLQHVREDPEALAAFLSFRSHFHEYSLNNSVLIWMQNQDARHVKGYRAWQAVGRQVRKGETGLVIFAPIVRKPTKAEIASGADPTKRSVAGYRTATVFDYAQTDAAEDSALTYVPPSPRLDAPDPRLIGQRLEMVALSIGYRVFYGDTGYADGLCQPSLKSITVQRRMSAADRASVLCHELAHAVAHENDRTTSRAQKELQAEGAAYIVLATLGLDTARASLPYLKSWSDGADDALLAELGTIDKIARDLLSHIEQVA